MEFKLFGLERDLKPLIVGAWMLAGVILVIGSVTPLVLYCAILAVPWGLITVTLEKNGLL